MATAAETPARSMGHIALHYGTAEDGPKAAKLLKLLGMVETQVLPLPDGNFYRFVVGEGHHARGDGIMYLSALPERQRKLIEAIHDTFNVGTDNEHEAVQGWRQMLIEDPESSFHFGFLLNSLEDLERITLDLKERAESDPDLKGHIEIGLNRSRPGDEEVDARLDASPLFGDVTRYAYGRNGVQVFVKTDLIKAGQLGDGMVIELDYVFPDRENHILSVVEM